MTKLSTILFILLLTSITSFSNDKVDSLLNANLTEVEDSTIIKNYIIISQEYSYFNYDSAFIYLNEALILSLKNNTHKFTINIYSDLGRIYFAKGLFDESIHYFQKALHLSEKYHFNHFTTAILFNIGSIKVSQEKYDEAILIFRKTEHIFNKKKGDFYNQSKASIYNNIGIVYEKQLKYDSAFVYYKKALNIAKKYDDKILIPRVYSNLGSLNVKLKRYENSEEFYIKALKLRKEEGSLFEIARSLMHLGELYIILNKEDKAEAFLLEGLNNSEKVGALEISHICTNLLNSIYTQRKDFEKAHKMLTLHKQLNDSILNKNSIQKLTRLNMQFDFNTQQKELKEQQKKKEIYILIIGIILVFMVIILSLLYFLQKNRLVKNKLQRKNLVYEKQILEEKLDLKNKKLMTSVMYQLQKNELISGIVEKLTILTKSLKKENIAPVTEVIRELRKSLDEQVWEEFEIYFQSVHTNFFKELDKRFNLTPNERKMCAFLKLNMTTKEIATITGQSDRSIFMARYRLRQKLEITNTEQSLSDFLASIE